MNQYFSIAVRAAFTFVAFVALAFKIPYYLLVAGGLIAGFFVWKTSDDRALSLGIIIGSVVFGVFEFIYGQV